MVVEIRANRQGSEGNKIDWKLTRNTIRLREPRIVRHAALGGVVDDVWADFVAVGVGAGLDRCCCCGCGCEGEGGDCDQAEEVGGEHFGGMDLFSLRRFVRWVCFVLWVVLCRGVSLRFVSWSWGFYFLFEWMVRRVVDDVDY